MEENTRDSNLLKAIKKFFMFNYEFEVSMKIGDKTIIATSEKELLKWYKNQGGTND